MAGELKTRQMELGMAALAERLAGVGDLPTQDKIWTQWMETPGSFGHRLEHWQFLAEKVGVAMGQHGWPKDNPPAMEAFLAWARPQRGTKAASFDESRFIRVALAQGWRSGGESVEACAWARSMDERRLASLALPGVKSSKRERASALAASIDLGPAKKSGHEWGKIAAREPGAAGYLFAAAYRQFARDPWVNKGESGGEEDYLRAMGVAAFLDKKALSEALIDVVGGWPSDNEKTMAARARMASGLASLGADWAATREGRDGRQSGAVERIIEAKNAAAAEAAIEGLGAEAFWARAMAAWKSRFDGPGPDARDAGAAAAWLGSLERGDQGCAMYLLERVCSDLAEVEAPVVAKAFESVGALAKVGEMSPWSFAGFAAPNSGGRALDPQGWSKARYQECGELSRHGANSATGAFIEGMAKHGAAPPWRELKPGVLSPLAEAAFEGWILSAAMSPLAGEAPSGRGPTRI